MANPNSHLLCRSISQSLGGREVLRDVSLSVGEREFVALLGPSGSGKTSLLRLFAGLVPPTSGELQRVDGETSFVFQDPQLLPWRNALENVCLPLEFARIPLAERQLRADEALDLVSLQSAWHLRPHELSGGMRMRVSLARALVTRPKLLLLDEPFAALDELQRVHLEEELFELWRRLSMTVVLVTHSISEAVYLSERVLYLSPQTKNIAWEESMPWGIQRARDLRLRADFHSRVHDLGKRIEASDPRTVR